MASPDIQSVLHVRTLTVGVAAGNLKHRVNHKVEGVPEVLSDEQHVQGRLILPYTLESVHEHHCLAQTVERVRLHVALGGTNLPGLAPE